MALTKTEIREGCGIITITREDALNAINSEVIKALKDDLRVFYADDMVRSVIITGAGTKAFIAGADIKEMETLTPQMALEFAKRGQDTTNFIESFPKPVIAAVNGYALGGGCEIALACHIRIASSNAVFGQPEVKLGIIPGWGGTQRLPRIVGKGHAIEMITTGALFDAAKALQIGLVNYIVEPGQLLEKALSIGRQINKVSPVAVEHSLSAINHGMEMTSEFGIMNEAQLFKLTFNSQDKSEGLNAFIEKREPHFTGK